MSAGKKADEMRKAAIVNLDIPVRDAAKGALGEIEKIKEKGEHPPAKVQPVEPADAKPAEKTMLPEAPEHPERSEGAGWYASFSLLDNPFKYIEASIEEDIEGLLILETPMLGRVKALVEGEISCVVVGERGCGKSLLVRSLKFEDMGIRKPERAITAVTPRDVDDLYSKIFGGACDVEFMGFREKVMGNEKVGRAARSLGGPFLGRMLGYDKRTQEPICLLCKIHCSGFPLGPEPDKLSDFFQNAPPGCKAKRMVITNMLRDSDFIGMTFLLDSPDNITGHEYAKFISLCGAILSGGANLILFCTPGQADALRESDTLARLSLVKWDSPSKEFFMKLFTARVDMSRAEGSTAPHPFTDGAVEKIASLANYNVRDFIRICSMVLTEMWMRKMASPCTPTFLSELNIRPAAPNDRTTIVRILKRHEGQWAGIQGLAKEISEAVGAPFTERKVGAMVRELGFGQFKHGTGGKMQVLISPSVLNAIK